LKNFIKILPSLFLFKIDLARKIGNCPSFLRKTGLHKILLRIKHIRAHYNFIRSLNELKEFLAGAGSRKYDCIKKKKTKDSDGKIPTHCYEWLIPDN